MDDQNAAQAVVSLCLDRGTQLNSNVDFSELNLGENESTRLRTLSINSQASAFSACASGPRHKRIKSLRQVR